MDAFNTGIKNGFRGGTGSGSYLDHECEEQQDKRAIMIRLADPNEVENGFRIAREFAASMSKYGMKISVCRCQEDDKSFNSKYGEGEVLLDNLHTDLPMPWEIPPPKVRHRATDTRPMNEELFWLLIEESRPKSVSERFSRAWCEEFTGALTTKLKGFKKSSIVRFNKLIGKPMKRLCTKAMCDVLYIVNKQISEDAFEYGRLGIISLGREVVDAVAADPTRLGDFVTPGEVVEFELLRDAAGRAIYDIGWDDFDEYIATGELRENPEEEDSRIRARYPALAAKFGF
jgi:hypothetical protein